MRVEPDVVSAEAVCASKQIQELSMLSLTERSLLLEPYPNDE